MELESNVKLKFESMELESNVKLKFESMELKSNLKLELESSLKPELKSDMNLPPASV